MNITELQSKLDVQKWLESETKGRDMCGAYDFCAYCENEEEFPCANAYERCRSKAVEQTAVQRADAKPEVVEQPLDCDEEVAADVAPDPVKKKRVTLTFEQRLAQSSDDIKDLHRLVCSILTDAGLKSSMTRSSHNFTCRRKVAVKIRLCKRYIRLHMALDPSAERYAKIPHKDDSDKKTHVKTPFAFKVSSPLSVRRLQRIAPDLLG